LLSNRNRDVKGMVNNFEDDGKVLNRGGVAVLWTRGVRGSSIFDGSSGNIFVGRSIDDGDNLNTTQTLEYTKDEYNAKIIK
jgi:hypothetical protein